MNGVGLSLALLVSVLAVVGCSGDAASFATDGAGAPGGSGVAGATGGLGGVSGSAGATSAGGTSAGTSNQLGGAGVAMGLGGTTGGNGAGAGGGNGGNGGGADGVGGGLGGGTSGNGGGNAGARKATIVVRGAGTATAGDEVMIARIKAHGFAEVAVVSDAAVTASSVAASDLVVISSSAESGPLQAKLKDIAIPVLCVEDAEFTKMGMASAGDHATGITQVVIAVPSSPLVGTATGTLTISSKPGDLGWATPAATALKGATLPGNEARVVVFGYEKGTQMATMAAPARRAGFAIREALAANLNADGLKLFDSILEWVIQ